MTHSSSGVPPLNKPAPPWQTADLSDIQQYFTEFCPGLAAYADGNTEWSALLRRMARLAGDGFVHWLAKRQLPAPLNLRLVTITGIDERTSLAGLTWLSKRYPFVEWGCLLSLKRQGFEPRYPSLRFLECLEGLPLRLSAHLCGTLARDAAELKNYPIETARQLIPGAARIQINLGADIDEAFDLYSRTRYLAVMHGIQMILQTHSFSTQPVTDAAAHSEFDLRNPSAFPVVFLHDASGGQGLTGHFDRPASGRFVGFAGGIGPSNVEKTLHHIAALDFSAPFWIDMVSGVRTDDWLDLAKVEEVLRLAEPYVAKVGAT